MIERSPTAASYSTINAGRLKRHMLVHSFGCTQYNYACTQAGALKEHMVTHKGETNFICTHCDYSCTQLKISKSCLLLLPGNL